MRSENLTKHEQTKTEKDLARQDVRKLQRIVGMA